MHCSGNQAYERKRNTFNDLAIPLFLDAVVKVAEPLPPLVKKILLDNISNARVTERLPRIKVPLA
jgi:hypothetical protein